MWSKLAQIAVISGSTPAVITPDDYAQARQAFTDAVRERWGRLPKSAAPPLFGLDAVLFHRGQAHQPHPRRRSLATCTHEVDWNDVAARTPQLAETARRYLAQLHVSLRASSVAIVDTTLRQFAGLLAAEHPEITGFADVGREHIEHYKTWLTARPGCRRSQTLSKTTIGLRMGNLRIFFERIIEWDYDDAPGRNPVFAGDLRSRTGRYHASWTTRPPPRCSPQQRALPELFDRLAVELLARTGMRKGEFLGLRIDTVVQIGSAFWLRTPVGKMHTDRYVPLHTAQDAARRLARRTSRLAEQRSAVHRPRPPDPALARGPGGAASRHQRRHRTRPPPPATAHPGHAGHQPRHEPGGHCRAARPRLAADDGALRPPARRHRPAALGSRPKGRHRRTGHRAGPRRAAGRSGVGQATSRPRHPGPPERVLRATGAEDLPARQRLPDLPDVHHHRRVPAPAPRAPAAGPRDHHSRRGPAARPGWSR